MINSEYVHIQECVLMWTWCCWYVRGCDCSNNCEQSSQL